jgi:hypothetical protein
MQRYYRSARWERQRAFGTLENCRGRVPVTDVSIPNLQSPMLVDTSGWSGEGLFTQQLVDRLPQIEGISLVRVEDAPASRSEADYNFISNEVYVAFAVCGRREPIRRFGVLPGSRIVTEKAMTMGGLETALSAMPDIGAPDYSDDGMLQYLRAERVVAPYQSLGYKLVELVRVYEAGGVPIGAGSSRRH